MKKTKKALVSLAIAGMALTMPSLNAFADNGVTTARLFGSDRVGTAIEVADAGWTSANTVILAPSAGANLVDVLAAAPLAGNTSPILLTDNNILTNATKIELVKLGVKNVYVVGAISPTVVDQVNAMTGVTATVLKGADRIGTAAAISAKLTAPAGSFVVGYGALADALSVASYAAANNYSILVANLDGSLPISEASYLGSKVYIIGGPTLVANIPGATRLFGADRFATNQAVLEALTYKYDHAYVANGTDAHLIDALVTSSLAAKDNSPIVLCDTNSAATIAAARVQDKLPAKAIVIAIGGSEVVPDAVVGLVASYTDSTSQPATLAEQAQGQALLGDTPEARAAGKPGPHAPLNNNPVPTYKANATSTFMSKDAVLALNQDNSKLTSIVLETWGAHRIADDPSSGVSGDIEDGRMVYVEKFAFPGGVDTKGGYYDDATVTNTLDAETGNPFETSVSGTLRPGTGHTLIAPLP